MICSMSDNSIVGQYELNNYSYLSFLLLMRKNNANDKINR